MAATYLLRHPPAQPTGTALFLPTGTDLLEECRHLTPQLFWTPHAPPRCILCVEAKEAPGREGYRLDSTMYAPRYGHASENYEPRKWTRTSQDQRPLSVPWHLAKFFLFFLAFPLKPLYHHPTILTLADAGLPSVRCEGRPELARAPTDCLLDACIH
jgi:hypothetical protein